jgi:hypothetical protein
MKIEIELTPEQVAKVVAQARDNQEVQSGLRPGQAVADVGGAQTLNADEMPYVGPLNPDLLDRLDWAWYSQNQHRVVGPSQMFDRKPWLGVRSTGMLYHAGDLATADLSGYYVAGSVFAPFLK